MRDLNVIAEAAMVTSAHDRASAPVDHAPFGAPARSLWPPRIVGEKSGRFYFLDANEVESISAAGNYVVAHLGGSGYLTRATLKRMLAQFAPLGFVQIDRSLVVNLRHVAHVERGERGQYCFVMRSGDRLVSSRERHAAIRALLLAATALLPT